MKYLIRLIIVLALACGIGYLTYFLITDNSNFDVNSYINQVLDDNKETYNKIASLATSVNTEFKKFKENKVIYDDYKESVIYLNSYLLNAKITKTERSEIKKAFEEFNTEFDKLKISLNSLESYLKEQNKNSTETEGRKLKAANDLILLNKAFYKVNETLEKIVLNKIFEDKYLDAGFAINSCKNLLNKCYVETCNDYNLESGKKYDLVSSVIRKNKTLKTNNYRVNANAVNFAINYNGSISNVLNDFTDYFASDTRNDNVNSLLGFLESEAYYEKN